MLSFIASTAKAQGETNKKLNHSDFIWDQIMLYVAYSAGVLFVIGVGQEFLGTSEVRCLYPAASNRDQAAFLNSVCAKTISEVELLPLIFLLEAVLVAIPHVIWKRLAKPTLEQFFSMAPTIARYRDKRTGLFEADTLDTVRCLQDQFSGSNALQYSYTVKTTCQLAALTVFTCVAAFRYRLEDFEEQFECDVSRLTYPPDWFVTEISGTVCTDFSQISSPSVSPSLAGAGTTSNVSTTNLVDACVGKSVSFRCVFRAANILGKLWIANFGILSVGKLAAIYSLMWLLPLSRFAFHWQELDYKGQAMFLYDSCSHQGDKYQPNSNWLSKCYVKSDLDLLVMMLFAYDKGHGRTFYEVQVEIALDNLWAEDYENYVTFQNRLADHISKRDYIWRTQSTFLDLDCDRSNEDNRQLHCNETRMFAKFPAELALSHLRNRRKMCYDLGLHLFCGGKGATVHLSKLCDFLFAVDFDFYFNPLQKRERPPDQDDFPPRSQVRHRKGKSKSTGISNRARRSSSSNEEDRQASAKLHMRMPSPTEIDAIKRTFFRDELETLQIFTVPDTIMTKNTSQMSMLTRPLRMATKRLKDTNPLYDLVVVSRLEPPDRTITTRNVIRSLQDCFHDECVFLFFSLDENVLTDAVAEIEFLKPLEREEDSSSFERWEFNCGSARMDVFVGQYGIDCDKRNGLSRTGDKIDKNRATDDKQNRQIQSGSDLVIELPVETSL